MPLATPINDQPIASTFFGEGKWLTDFVTPDALEVQKLHDSLTEGIYNLEDKLLACWEWVADEVKYVSFVRAKMWVNGHSSVQNDYWQNPSQVIRTKIGNCSNKAFLLASLIRNDLAPGQVSVVLGNLHQPPGAGGHAWLEVNFNSHPYIMESTKGDMQPMVATRVADIYEPVVYFNDKTVSAIEGRTLLMPFCAVYVDWLRDYLDFAFIQMTTTIARCSVCGYPLSAEYLGQIETCPLCATVNEAVSQGVTIPTPLLVGILAFLGGMFFGPAIIASSTEGQKWLERQIRRG